MDKTELVKKVQELRKAVSEKELELIKGTLKDTSSLKKTRRELASMLTKLNAMQHGS